jgi:hypothetical protein
MAAAGGRILVAAGGRILVAAGGRILVAAGGRILVAAGGRILAMETAYLHDLHAECLEPGEQPVQGSLIAERAVQHGFDRLNRGGEPFEVEQSFRRYDPDHADLVVGRWHCGPQAGLYAQWPSSYGHASRRGAPHS